MVPHGAISLSWSQDTLVLATAGPFNLDGATNCFEQLKQFVADKSPIHWLRMDLIDEEAFGEPAVMKVFSSTYVWAFEHGCKALALVCESLIHKSMCTQFMQANHYNIEVFKSKADALAWLASQ